MKCLLIETKDKRKFLTDIKNAVYIKEFIKKFQAKTSEVSADKKYILTIDELAKEICENRKQKELIYEPIKKQSIQDIIEEKIKNKESFSVKSIKKELNIDISDQALYYHIRKAKNKNSFVEIKGIKKEK